MVGKGTLRTKEEKARIVMGVLPRRCSADLPQVQRGFLCSLQVEG